MISVHNRLDQGKSITSDHRDWNWELHDGAEDRYEHADMDVSSDPKANIPLTKISSGNRTTPIRRPKKTTQEDNLSKLSEEDDLWEHDADSWNYADTAGIFVIPELPQVQLPPLLR